jgi:hypothetical protein
MKPLPQTKENNMATPNPLDLFTAAPTIQAKSPSTAKKDVVSVGWGEDLDVLASLNLVEKALKGIRVQLRSEIESKAITQFASQMVATHQKPSRIDAHGENATGRILPRKKASSHKLDEETVEVLQSHEIPIEVIEKIPERIVINPEVLKDQDALTVIAELVQNDERLEGKTIFLRQEAESHYAVGEQTVAIMAQKAENQEQAEDLFFRVMGVTMRDWKINGTQDSAETLHRAVEIIKGAGLLQ